MGELVVDTFLTLDGVMQAPGGSDEDREEGFQYGGWQAPVADDESGQVIMEQIQSTDALLLGRKTYQIFAGYWPKAPADDPIAAHLNNVTKYVASHTMTTVEWTNSRLIEGDVAAAVKRMKEGHNEIHVIGSGNLVQTLLREELVDRFNLWVYPLLLGSGKRLFADGTIPTALHLVESKTFPKGAVLLTYRWAGKPTFANMA